ncbi:hypothetical protein QZH41_003206 [Actinostola sp. cb2023]|nr:hypothetical protein QZH41_003206 [Actinostola sp. cb2023]
MDIDENLSKYMSHLIRGKHQRECYIEEMKNLKPGHAVGVCDYMMKLMFKRLYEPQREWFGKNGASVHGVMFLFREEEDGPILTEYHDAISETDDTQNWFFSASCLEESAKNMKALHPEITSLSMWSDNGPHYKNSSLIIWLQKFKELTGIHLKKFSNFEAQKGKTKLDSHYATLKFALRQHMKEGHSVMCGEDIVQGTKDRLRGTHVYPIDINRQAEPPSAKTLAGISQYGDFEYTSNGIVMRENTNIGEGKLYTNANLNKHFKNDISTTSASTDFYITYAKTVNKLLPKGPKSKSNLRNSFFLIILCQDNLFRFWNATWYRRCLVYLQYWHDINLSPFGLYINSIKIYPVNRNYFVFVEVFYKWAYLW